jgi:hypothetical protein
LPIFSSVPSVVNPHFSLYALRITPHPTLAIDPMRLTLPFAIRIAIALLVFLSAQAVNAQSPAVALHYGADPPIDELQAFDLVVLEPNHVPAPDRLPARHTQWFAYVSVGELDRKRAYAAEMPAAWLRGDNPAWQTRLVDHTAAGWAEFFAAKIVGPLWQRGWRGFFLDTLDSHRLFAKTPQQRRAQEDALVAALELLHARYPGIKLFANRGFEILPRLKGRVHAVAAESLYRGWDAGAQKYAEVSAPDRDWLLAQLRRVKAEHQVPVVAIDYLPLRERALARETAARIRADGFIPWVTNGAIDLLGVGDIEVQPRRVAVLTDLVPGSDFQNSTAIRYLAAPLAYLGFTIEQFDVGAPLPEHLLQGRHAALVTWFSQPVASLNAAYPAWLKRQLDGGLRLVLMHGSGFAPDAPALRELGFEQVRAGGTMTVAQRSDWIGFEATPHLSQRPGTGLRWNAGSGTRERALQLRASDGTLTDAVGITPWGGFAFEPNAVRMPALASGARWIVHPIEFLRRAIGAPEFPVPDVTTEAGRRLLLVHIDGDGFVSRAERPGSPFAGEVMLTDVIQRYRIPHTVSIIQGEIAGNGMFKQLSPALEAIARRIFAQPHVEIASHSYSHPFFWRKLQAGVDQARYDKALNLTLPGYSFDLKAEIPGSIEYIDTRLAPPGKRTRVFLWTGDTVPTAEAVALADASGVLNMNGGDTVITNSEPTLTEVAGLGLRRGRSLQVFAPNQNENVYTNLWTGPFYGFERVIETFQLTETPLRLKPINIYYHTYSATKTASLTALHRVYAWALAQPVVPVYASDYIGKVLDFHALAVARDWRAAAPTWRVRGAGDLRTVRVGAATPVALGASRGVAGAAPGPQARYLHLASTDAAVTLAPEAAAPVHVRDAAGWIDGFARTAQPAGIRFRLSSYARASFTLAAAAGCRVRVDGREVTPAQRQADSLGFELPNHEVSTTPQRYLVDVRCGA